MGQLTKVIKPTTKPRTTTSINIPIYPILCILGCVLIVLRATEVIDWPWQWVLAPFWVPVALGLGVFVTASVIMLVVLLFMLIVIVGTAIVAAVNGDLR